MRLRAQRAPALLLLLPTLHALATTILTASEEKQVARAAVLPEYPALSALPSPSPSPASKATKDAPVDGLDGKPHEGPYVEGKPTVPKKLPVGVEEIRPGATRISSTQQLTKEEWKALGGEGDGVMDDPNRASPKGNTGTEGGVSAKDKDRIEQETKTGGKVEKIPDPPKEAPPLPHGEQERLKEKEPTETASKKLGAQGLEKPTDLPDTPHDIPHPVPPSVPKDDPLGTTPPNKISDSDDLSDDDNDDQNGVIQPFHSFILSLTMIIFSEIGDKTFLVAALMAMRHSRLVVFTAAFSALITMTVLSAVLGHAVPTLLPKRFTSFAAAGLFLVFGVKLMREGLAMSPDEGVGEEMKEVEMELEEKEHLARRNSRRKSSISPYVLESGRARRSRSNSRLPAPARSPSSSPSRSPSPHGSTLSTIVIGLNNLFSLLLSPAWVQTFIMTFLGEWGDRSQIATIAMAAGADYWWVTGGAIFGHGMCTAVAVLGGRAIAGKVSMRIVTLGGAIAFLAFGVIYLLEAIYSG
ncbi:UPF0016-domain-containing protein [Lindgomyces ingoldianus]|uniref:UPF0016-domain-containing protein n=1 Tax=Lindgomyces ingoldianus TaxID=673940 RepID=A0ACB6R291_9PLEO|nr:UPF0016-domain-containing protein [Lindgomyces ingoldianus]KAF2473296.1 UPF0016-domain-containing protein [Lindgomyces ingoldianus]